MEIELYIRALGVAHNSELTYDELRQLGYDESTFSIFGRPDLADIKTVAQKQLLSLFKEQSNKIAALEDEVASLLEDIDTYNQLMGDDDDEQTSDL